MLKVMVIDDELPSRELLLDMISEYEDLELLADFGNSKEALAAIQAQPPDIIFLDIQMPGIEGFELLEALPSHQRPAVIFVTAHQDYAHRAFEIDAIDYLLKPFDEARLAKAIRRARRRFGDSLEARPAVSAKTATQANGAYIQRIAVREGERNILLPISEIIWLESEGKLVRLNTSSLVYKIRDSLTRLNERLDPKHFLRVSRSAIVCIDRIQEVQNWFHGDRIIVMENGDSVTTTRSYRDALLGLLENK